nr:immunoglobulin heavy chain junction region [Macaca mulatta]MOW45508.1 immunoglobulin heavy chain junction region [Macaca mulatta]MOW45521.1 immunoglobulin heavy chain junction region [Macaca mulatta]MOW45549.1 immunoglobulin heavy chain junction region [Macaca mulatta]MOW45645.1 immunoglobulin heavy chain junction region [Macaca mulatta]
CSRHLGVLIPFFNYW